MTMSYFFVLDRKNYIQSIDNSFTQSLLEQVTKQASGFVKQMKFANVAVNSSLDTSLSGDNGADVDKDEAASNMAGAEMVSAATSLSSIAGSAANGSTLQFPQMFDDSKFSRTYDVSFRFMSPYGDDQSVFYNVILPFLFVLACAMPRQEGVSGVLSPYILQVDAPGYFSCPMGVVTSLSFRKGGDSQSFNRRGLPLIIEGTMSIMDLYSSLSMPTMGDQFATNFGTSTFLDNLGGLTIYNTLDPSISFQIVNYLSNLGTRFYNPINIGKEKINDMRRMLGIATN